MVKKKTSHAYFSRLLSRNFFALLNNLTSSYCFQVAIMIYIYIYIYIYIDCVNPFTHIDPLCRSRMTLIFPWDVLCRSFKLWRFRCQTTLLRVCSLKKWKINEFLRRSEKTAWKKVDLIKSYSILNIFFSSGIQSLYSWLY